MEILKSEQNLLGVTGHKSFIELVVLVVLFKTACANVLQKHIQVLVIFMCTEILDDVLVLQAIEKFDFLLERSYFPLLCALVGPNLADKHLFNGDLSSLLLVNAFIYISK